MLATLLGAHVVSTVNTCAFRARMICHSTTRSNQHLVCHYFLPTGSCGTLVCVVQVHLTTFGVLHSVGLCAPDQYQTPSTKNGTADVFPVAIAKVHTITQTRGSQCRQVATRCPVDHEARPQCRAVHTFQLSALWSSLGGFAVVHDFGCSSCYVVAAFCCSLRGS